MKPLLETITHRKDFSMKLRAWLLLFSLFALLFGTDTMGSVISQEMVAEGRYLLFNSAQPGGEPTYSAILLADDRFEAAAADDPADQDARLFRSVTRIMAFALENGGAPDSQTLLDLLERFGIKRNSQELLIEPPVDEPPQINGRYNPPASLPSGENVHAFLAGPFLACLDASIADMEAIDSGYSTTITAGESGDLPVEIDHGDILVVKAAMNALRSIAGIVTAYNLDLDLRELVALINAGVGQIQRDLLDPFPDLFARLDGGIGQDALNASRTTLFNSVDDADQAYAILAAGGRGDHLFFFEDDDARKNANLFLARLREIKTSLEENRPADLIVIREVWTLTDVAEPHYRLHVQLERDQHGNLIEGDVYGIDGCDFLFCSGAVDGYEIDDGQATLSLSSGGWCPAAAVLTATLSSDQMTAGTYEVTDCYGTRSGSFTGQRIEITTDEHFLDFNTIFGNVGKPSLDLRAVLPEFDLYDRPVPGSFPGDPVLNGFFPDVITNDDATRMFNLQPAGSFVIPLLDTIVIDGDPGDWPPSALVHLDPAGDSDGKDIDQVFMARDNDTLYMAMTFNDTLSMTDNAQYSLSLTQGAGGCWPDLQLDTRYESYLNDWHTYAWPGDYGDYVGQAASSPGFIEWQFPLLDIMNSIGTLNGYFITSDASGACPDGYCSDHNETYIRINTQTISGQVFCPAHTGYGNIYLYAIGGVIPRYAAVLSSNWVPSPGFFALDNLPVDSSVYLFGVWDTNHNGIFDASDFYGISGPWQIQENGTINAPITIDRQTDVSIEAETSIPMDATATIALTINDPDGWAFSVDWEVLDGGYLDINGTTAAFTPPEPSTSAPCETYRIRVKVTFDSGMVQEEIIPITVRFSDPMGDLDGDGDVDGRDLALLADDGTLISVEELVSGFGNPVCE
jgi:hypothetical protein